MPAIDWAFRDGPYLRHSFFLVLLGAAALEAACGFEPEALVAAPRTVRQDDALPKALRAALRRAKKKEGGPEYKFFGHKAASSFAAKNPRFGFSAQLSEDGLALRMDSSSAAAEPSLGVSLSRYGCAEAPKSALAVAPRLQNDRVEFVRDQVTEWYENGPLGLEHGFEVQRDPGCRGDLAFDLQLTSSADVTLQGDCGAKARLLVFWEGRKYVYRGLLAYDADGKDLPACMEYADGRIRLRVAAAGARYPLTVDPTWQQQQKLLANDKADGDQFGRSVALSADGKTALIGAYGEDDATGGATTDNGAVYVYTRSGTTWSQQQKLLVSDKKNFDLFGVSVALSGDGNTALVGAYMKDVTFIAAPPNPPMPSPGTGAAYVYTRSGSTFTQQQKLLASDGRSGDFFGVSVALSADGNTAVVGAHGEDDPTGSVTTDNGAAYVYTRSGSTWSQQQRLVASDKANKDFFGGSVALSADGNTALIGAYQEDDATGGATTDNGAVYLYTRSGSTWSQLQKLLTSDKATGDQFGRSVALSADGNTALIGASGEDDPTSPATTDNGAAYVFTRSGATFTQQQKLLTSDKATGDSFGIFVALSADGNTALIGALQEDDATGGATTNNGAAYVYTRSGSTFTQQQKFLAQDKDNGDFFGYSVALSASGDTALIGAFADSDATGGATSTNGAAYVFDFVTRLQNGSPCTKATDCNSAFCTDGVCCNSACGNSNSSDCQVCSTAAGAAVNGTCGFLPSTQVCRGAAGACDLAAKCSGTSAACPPNGFQPSTTVCRNATDLCDLDAKCSGTSAVCPPSFKPKNTVCRSATDLCDLDAKCSGTSAVCPPSSFQPSTTICRNAAGICDVAEQCTGSSAACPDDSFKPSTTICRNAAGICDVAEQCTGSSAACPDDSFKPSTTVCRPAVNSLDPAEMCTGQAISCPPNVHSEPLPKSDNAGTGCALAAFGAARAPFVSIFPSSLLLLFLLLRRFRARSLRT